MTFILTELVGQQAVMLYTVLQLKDEKLRSFTIIKKVSLVVINNNDRVLWSSILGKYD